MMQEVTSVPDKDHFSTTVNGVFLANDLMQVYNSGEVRMQGSWMRPDVGLATAQATARELELCLAEFPEGNGDAVQLHDRLTRELRALGFGVLIDFEHLIAAYEIKPVTVRSASNPVYCYSLNLEGESYDGQFSSLQEVLKAAAEECCQRWDFLDFPVQVWIGEVEHASELLVGHDVNFGARVVEQANGIVDEHMSDNDDVFSLDQDKELELGQMIEKFLIENGNFTRYTVANAKKYTVLDREGHT